MKKFYKGLLPITLLLTGLVLLPLAYPPLIGYLQAESKVYHTDVVLSLLKYAFVIIGLGSLLGTIYKRIQHSKMAKEIFYSVILTGLLLSVTFLVYMWKEGKLAKEGVVPGVLFAGYNYSASQPLKVNQFVEADAEGFCFFSKPLPWLKEGQFNAQGFICPVNADAATADSARAAGDTVVILIGDSYLMGVSENRDSVFLWQLERRHPGWTIFSFGVGGTSPKEYLAAAKKFAPVLKPSIIVVCFYLGNDVMYYDLPTVPYLPPFWDTNHGYLQSIVPHEFTEGKDIVLRTPEDASRYYRDRFTLWGRNDWKSRYFRRSRVLTQLYCEIFDEPKTNGVDVDSAVTYHYLKGIATIAHDAGSQFSVCVIPDPLAVDTVPTINDQQEEYGWVFKDLMPDTYFMEGVTSGDYLLPDKHFNNAGNRKFANVLSRHLTERLRRQTPASSQ